MVICYLFWVVRFIWDRKLWLVQNYGCRRGLSENSELVKQAGAEPSSALIEADVETELYIYHDC